MITSALMVFLHHLMASALTACLVYEFIAYRKNMRLEEMRRIQRVDLVYGISAGIAIPLLAAPLMARGIGMN